MDRELILGVDPAWGGFGWAVATDDGPIRVGWAHPGGRTWRAAALVELFDEVFGVAEAEARRRGLPPRLAFELAPQVYAGRGNQAATAFGLGQVAGAVEVAGVRPGWRYPWGVAVADWRKWWVVGGAKWPTGKGARDRCKEHALATVRFCRWGHLLAPPYPEPRPWGSDPKGSLGDVCEALLLAAGAARRSGLAPRGPAGWTDGAAPGTIPTRARPPARRTEP